jgi:hypothetical protein
MAIPKSKRSGGPKTLEGRVASSRNAVKTGSYSAQIALSSEEEADFKAFEDEFMNDFEPQGVVESSMVHELTVLAWKKLRLERVEHQLMRDQLKSPITPQEYIDSGFEGKGGAEFALKQLDRMDDQFIAVHTKDLELARSLKKDRHNESVLQSLDQDHPDFYVRLQKVVRQLDRGQQQIIVAWTGIDNDKPSYKTKRTAADIPPSILTEALDQTIEESEAVIHVSKNIVYIQGLKSKILDKRLMGMMESATSHRVHEDLGRLFSRRLKELREQQSWRLKRDIIDVLSEEE